ncbi:MAG: SsrA-binding protein SmpB [Anaerolineae bacterium]
MKNEGIKHIAENRRARHDYDLEDTYEAGLSLMGSEIKSIREGKVNLRQAYVQIKDGEAWVYDMHISPYTRGGYANHQPMRPRRLLLHKDEIRRLGAQVAQKGYTIVPTRLYLKRGRAKLEIALGKGRKAYDKRQAIAEREAQRDIERGMREKW